MQEHLDANKVWALIRDKGDFSPEETTHIRECEQCIDWLTAFADLARRSGFKITFLIPQKTKTAW